MKNVAVALIVSAAIFVSGVPGVQQPTTNQLTCVLVARKSGTKCWCSVNGKPYKAPVSFCTRK